MRRCAVVPTRQNFGKNSEENEHFKNQLTICSSDPTYLLSSLRENEKTLRQQTVYIGKD